MPGPSHSSDRLQFFAIALAALVMVAVVLIGHVTTSPPDHLLGPDLLYASVIGIMCLGAVGIWALTRRAR